MGECCSMTKRFQTQDQTVAHHAKCYMVSCMDFRLIDDIVNFMDAEGYNNNYDQFILAGASLGFTQTKFPHWGQSLMDHMGIGQDLHSFREIIFIDHLDCGAFKKFYPDIKEKEKETFYHAKHMQDARDQLASKFPNFKFRGFLMDVDGSVRQMIIDNRRSSYVEVQKTQDDHFLAGIKESFGLTSQTPFPMDLSHRGEPVPPVPHTNNSCWPNGLNMGHRY